MRTLVKCMLGVAAFAIAPAAHAATYLPGDMDANGFFNLAIGSDGNGSGAFGALSLPDGTFSDTFEFMLMDERFITGSVTTNGSGVRDLDFQSATFFNGTDTFDLSIMTNGQLEVINFTKLLGLAGTNSLTINYLARGEGSYGGQVAISPVPEPATWAMMIFGFGAVGVAMRRRKDAVRVAYA